MRKFYILLIFILLTSCTVHEDTYYRNLRANKAAEAVQHKTNYKSLDTVQFIKSLGVSINFENISGYRKINYRKNTYAYRKILDNNKHTAAIVIYPVYPPHKLTSRENFVNELKKDLLKLKDKQGKDLVFTIESSNGKAPWCVLFHRTAIIKRKGSYVYDSYEYICKNPYKKNKYINLGYSESYPYTGGIKDISARFKETMKIINIIE